MRGYAAKVCLRLRQCERQNRRQKSLRRRPWRETRLAQQDSLARACFPRPLRPAGCVRFAAPASRFPEKAHLSLRSVRRSFLPALPVAWRQLPLRAPARAFQQKQCETPKAMPHRKQLSASSGRNLATSRFIWQALGMTNVEGVVTIRFSQVCAMALLFEIRDSDFGFVSSFV